MDSLSALLIIKSLDGLALRSAAISQNVANASSPGYTPVSVSFEEQLRTASKQGEDAVRRVNPQLLQNSTPSGTSELRLDLELARASETTLRYAALIDVLSRQMQISRLAVTGAQ